MKIGKFVNNNKVCKVSNLLSCLLFFFFVGLHSILGKFQSGFRRMFSAETAFLRVSNDILMQRVAGEFLVLVLLDLSAALDKVDHRILIEKLRTWLGISGSTLNLFSYLSHRSCSVASASFVSSSASLTCGVPQGSVLGPLLFSLYMLPLRHILSKRHLIPLLRR